MSAAPAARARVLATWCGVAAVALVAGLVPAGGATARDARPAPIGSDRFVVGQPYRGDFPDPTVLRVGKVYYAYSTTDLDAEPAGDELARPGPLAGSRRGPDERRHVGALASHRRPHVRRHLGADRGAFRQPLRARLRRPAQGTPAPVVHRGLDVEEAVRRVRGPLDAPAAVPRHARRHRPGVLHRTQVARTSWSGRCEQTRRLPSQIYINRLSANGLRVIDKARLLLTTQDAWESPLIENPAMIRYRARYYLFYSGGSYADDSYATGYAICATPYGPVHARHRPAAARHRRTGGRDRAARCRSSIGSVGCGWRTPPGTIGNTGYPQQRLVPPATEGLPAAQAARRDARACVPTAAWAVVARG